MPADVDGTRPEQRVVEQAARLPLGGAVTGWASLRMSGAAFFDGLETDGRTPQPVPLAVGMVKIRGDERVLISREPLAASEVVVRHGVPCTRPPRGLFDEMRRTGDWRDAVVAADMAAAADLVSARQMRQLLDTLSHWRRSTVVRRALPLVSELSRSPNESRMRLLWVVDAGLPAPLVNRDVFTRTGRLVAVADLLDTEAGVVAEYDGADHRSARRHSPDVVREDALHRLGLEYLTVTGPDLARPSRVVDRMLATRSRAAFAAESERLWTVQPPPGWQRAETLDELLERRAWLARIHG